MPWRASRVRYADVVAVEAALGCPEPVAWALVRRGMADPEEARAFLAAADPTAPLEPPESIPGVMEAAERLALAVRRSEPIVVHGDYDCDGICATAILVRALEVRGARVRPFLPSRFTDGYGVNAATVERLAAEGCRILACVDCGTSAVEPLRLAVELGMQPIVCDHHLAGGQRPPAIIANPALGRADGPLPCAAGVAFKVTQALAALLDGDPARAAAPLGGGHAPPAEEALDLVALATVADAVALVGENRRLVARGLAAMRTSPRPAIAALCAAAGVPPRALDARALGFQIAPAINAAGRMAHPDRALELLLSADRDAATPLAADLHRLNLERRETEQRVTDLAIATVEASPAEQRDADAIVVMGDGWHEGVVGIVAARLVERFGRPAIALSRADGRAKGSGRSLPGVDLHGLVAASSGTLVRWGGHAGAVGLELRDEDVPRFREELAAAARGARAAIARARVRTVDAVVGPRDLVLGTAEALEALAPFGNGNPEVRLLLAGCEVGGMVRVGEGRHLQIRLRAGGAHLRAIGFGLGARAPGIDANARHDAVVRLSVDRWQDLVSPQVALEALEPLEAPVEPLRGLCRQGCDAGCPERASGEVILEAVDAPDGLPSAPEAPGPALGVRDRRGLGAAVAALAALAGADGGVVAVVSDVARRRTALEGALEPGRLGAESGALGGARCDRAALRGRIALARGGPLLAMVDYEVLAAVEPPAGAHIVLVDPPPDAEAAGWVAARAAGRWLHLVYGPEEIRFAAEVAAAEWELRPTVTALWMALRDGRMLPWGPELERLLLGEGPVMRPPRLVGRALAILRELGLAEVGPQGVRADPAAPRRDLGESPRYRACQRRLEATRAFLAMAPTLSFAPAPEDVPEPLALRVASG
jgi:single-stranded-DNA-specific exonuclease